MAPRARLRLGDHVPPPEGSAEVQPDELGVARTQLQSAAAVGNSGHRGARPGSALSPTARVMNATWMNSDSQLSTYMNHMAPPGRRDGPARSGSRDTERPPPCCPRPTDTERSGAEHRRPCAPAKPASAANRRGGSSSRCTHPKSPHRAQVTGTKPGPILQSCSAQPWSRLFWEREVTVSQVTH